MELNHQKCSQGYINERVHHKTLPICYKSNKLHNIRTIRKTVKAQKMINVILFGLYIQLINNIINVGGNGLVQANMIQEEQVTSNIKCGDMKQCATMFRQATLSHNLSYDLSLDKIEEICLKLKKAIKCFNDYRKTCIESFHHSKISSSFFDQLSEGPLGLTMELCNNPKFRQDYSTLGPCQKQYRSEFDRCLKLNHSSTVNKMRTATTISSDKSGTNDNGIENKNLNINSNSSSLLERFIEHCCALHNYHNCIYDISESKCGRDAAAFSLKILELFNRGYLRDCSKYANLSQLCVRQYHYLMDNSTTPIITGSRSLILLLICVLVSITISIIGISNVVDRFKCWIVEPVRHAFGCNPNGTIWNLRSNGTNHNTNNNNHCFTNDTSQPILNGNHTSTIAPAPITQQTNISTFAPEASYQGLSNMNPQ